MRCKSSSQHWMCFRPSFSSKGIAVSSIRNAIRRFVREELGATLVEYGIMVLVVGVLALAVVKVVGSKASNDSPSIKASM